MKTSIVLVTYCPTDVRYGLCERSFTEIHGTGVDRKEYELIVFNNGGIHADLIEGLDADIVLSADHNIGVGAAFNAGISIALGDTLALMQDDLGYKDGWLARGIDIAKRFPGYVTSLLPCDELFITGEIDDELFYSRKVPMSHIMSRKFFHQIGLYRNNIFSPGGEWIKRLIRSGSRFVVSRESYIFHIGARLSIIGGNKEAIKSYRRVHD